MFFFAQPSRQLHLDGCGVRAHALLDWHGKPAPWPTRPNYPAGSLLPERMAARDYFACDRAIGNKYLTRPRSFVRLPITLVVYGEINITGQQ